MRHFRPKQGGKPQVKQQVYIPRTKARLSDYQHGPVTVSRPSEEPSTKANPASDAFLQSYEWKRVRMEALKKYGNRCQCCGATPANGVRINVDHIKPRKLFPSLALSLSNLQVLCEDCNHGKGNWDMTDWRNRETQAG